MERYHLRWRDQPAFVCPSVRPLTTTKKFFAEERRGRRTRQKATEEEENHSSGDGFGTADEDEVEEAAQEDCNGPEISSHGYSSS